MFSLFNGGIQDTVSSKFIDLPELVRLIRCNPQADKIDIIRNLRKNGDEYRELKRTLPNITPHCLVKIRNLKENCFEQNFIQSSQYLYFDVDIINAEEYKEDFIKRYKKLASMICLSSSGGGISVLFKLKNTITKDNFDDFWLTVRNTILINEPIDMICKDIGRAMFISHDPSLYYNFENEIEVELNDSIPKPVKKRGNQYKTGSDLNFTLNSLFPVIDINEVLKKLRTSTSVEVSNPVFDFKSVEYTKVYIPSTIMDGTKHTIYTSIIHTLYYLNPTIDQKYIFSYLYYVNSRHAKPSMEKREFIRLFNCIYNGIKNTGENYCKKKIKYVHFNSNCELTKKEKIDISNMVNGSRRKNNSAKRVREAVIEIQQKGQKITQKRIAEISGLSPKTVRAHLNSTLIDMDELVEMINNSIVVD